MTETLRNNAAEEPCGELFDQLTDSEKEFGWMINDINKLISKTFARKMKKHGITEAQWRLIANVNRHEGSTQTQLAELLETSRAPLGRLLDRMEASGLVERRPDPSDRRINRIYLREEAMEMAPMIEAMGSEGRLVLSTALSGISEEEIRTTLSVLEQIKENLSKIDATESSAI